MIEGMELPPLIGESPSFLALMERVELAAPQDRPILVIGERGSGKELVATRLHYLSKRWQGPLVQLNCAALPDNLLETELFGHEAGAFTGAGKRRIGRFELADGGTLFLDEIAAATQKAQEKILRAIEYGTFERVGGNETLKVDVRVIGATNVDLPSEAAAGRFRYDLLDRMSFDVLTVPQLRHRQEDIPLLAHHFGRAMAQELADESKWDGFPGFAPSAREALLAHNWPGNVRELKNVVERAVYLHGDPESPLTEITFDPFESPYRPGPKDETRQDIAAKPQPGPDITVPDNLKKAVANYEKSLITAALKANRHNQKTTAQQLGLTYNQLRSRLGKYGVDV